MMERLLVSHALQVLVQTPIEHFVHFPEIVGKERDTTKAAITSAVSIAPLESIKVATIIVSRNVLNAHQERNHRREAHIAFLNDAAEVLGMILVNENALTVLQDKSSLTRIHAKRHVLRVHLVNGRILQVLNVSVAQLGKSAEAATMAAALATPDITHPKILLLAVLVE